MVQEDGSEEEKDGAGLMVSHALAASRRPDATMWIVESGATSHMCKDAALFSDLQPLDGSLDVTLGDGHALRTTGRGRVRLTVELNCGKSFCTLSEVMLVPGLAYNLLSVAKVSEQGGTTEFAKTSCRVSIGGRVVACTF